MVRSAAKFFRTALDVTVAQNFAGGVTNGGPTNLGSGTSLNEGEARKPWLAPCSSTDRVSYATAALSGSVTGRAA